MESENDPDAAIETACVRAHEIENAEASQVKNSSGAVELLFKIVGG